MNGYIIHKAYHAANNSNPLTHVKYLKQLSLELCQLSEIDMFEENTFGTDVPAPSVMTLTAGTAHPHHLPMQVEEWREDSGQFKRKQRACKVCSLFRTGNDRARSTTFYCDGCNDSGPIHLCMKPQRKIRGILMTCWVIWHREYQNGSLIPHAMEKKIGVRRTSGFASPPPRKRKQRASAPSSPSSTPE